MMYRLFFACILLISLSARGQYVLIPDSNFRHALISAGYSACFDITQSRLDTTCSGVFNATALNLSFSNISDLEGLQYFKSLSSLRCSNNPLHTLPVLPITLTYLECNADQLTSLPTLPDSLSHLDCEANLIDSIPILPNSLTFLDISQNFIHDLPPLPSTLSFLDVAFNGFRDLPVTLPAYLRYFNCSNNILSHVPTLPDTLNYFICSSNQLSNLPLLPPTLVSVECNDNQIGSLPSLPASLQSLSCNNNQLSVLPTLPISLSLLECTNNKIVALPSLPPSLGELFCSNNLLTSLPPLPDTMSYLFCGYNPQLSCLPHLGAIVNFNFDSTAITCLPDTSQITNSSPELRSFPLCSPNSCYPLGMSELYEKLTMHPNPVRDVLHLDYPIQNSTVTICDMTGWVLLSPVAPDINVSDLPTGLYFLQIQNMGGILTKKFVKQ